MSALRRYGRKVLVLVAAIVALVVWTSTTDDPDDPNLSDPRLCEVVGECDR